MGSDLLLNYIYWDKANRPNWEGAREYIENLTAEDLKDHPEFEYVQMMEDDEDVAVDRMKSRLLDCHDTIRTYADGLYDRSTYMISMGKYDVLITGGDSWGDSPSEMFDVIQDWMNLPRLYEFGFFPDWSRG